MLYLLGNEIKTVCCSLLLALLFFAPFNANAQYSSGNNLNYMDFQQKPYYFGITLGYNSSNYKIFHSQNFIRNDSFARAESVTGPGFNLGIVSNLKIGESLPCHLQNIPSGTLRQVEKGVSLTAPLSPYSSNFLFRRVTNRLPTTISDCSSLVV
jgi:hypothetical protein